MNKYSVNLVVLVGRVGQEPEIRDTNSGVKVCNLSVATTSSYKKDGAYADVTEWNRVVLFGKPAEFAQNYIHKGDLVSVRGSLRTRDWEKDGQKHYMTEVMSDELVLLKSKNDAFREENTPEDVPF
jgi:single-strand DNA-binding protein